MVTVSGTLIASDGCRVEQLGPAVGREFKRKLSIHLIVVLVTGEQVAGRIHYNPGRTSEGRAGDQSAKSAQHPAAASHRSDHLGRARDRRQKKADRE